MHFRYPGASCSIPYFRDFALCNPFFVFLIGHFIGLSDTLLYLNSLEATAYTQLNGYGSYTISAAYACFLDKDIGSLSQGKLADFVVLSTDSWEKFSSGGSTSVQATYVGGIQAFP
ncbi:hypothetical protein LIER_12355 [Lithospermum erythrorhizon]|uniref:Amidohydrolase 3 domain-containing protein n=1 Tax=Lithospermum erythrorhizon TaxID=34254 RepID=A0AAV3PRK0_LITER